MPQLKGRVDALELRTARVREYLNQEYRQPVIYRMYGDGEELLYIGISANPYDRWSAHSRSKPWWPEVSYIRFESVQGLRWELEAVERQAIKRERPRHNKRSAVRDAS